MDDSYDEVMSSPHKSMEPNLILKRRNLNISGGVAELIPSQLDFSGHYRGSLSTDEHQLATSVDSLSQSHRQLEGEAVAAAVSWWADLDVEELIQGYSDGDDLTSDISQDSCECESNEVVRPRPYSSAAQTPVSLTDFLSREISDKGHGVRCSALIDTDYNLEPESSLSDTESVLDLVEHFSPVRNQHVHSENEQHTSRSDEFDLNIYSTELDIPSDVLITGQPASSCSAPNSTLDNAVHGHLDNWASISISSGTEMSVEKDVIIHHTTDFRTTHTTANAISQTDKHHSIDLQRHDVSMEGVSRDGNKVGGSEVSGTMESSVSGVNVIDERQSSSGHAGVVVARSTLDGDLSENRELSVRRGVDVGVQPSFGLQRHDVSMEGVSRDVNKVVTMESSVSGVNVIDERQSSSGHAGVVVTRSTLDGDLSDNRELSVRRGVDVDVQPSIDLQRHDVSMEGVSRDGNKVGGSEVSGTMESSVSGVNVIDERQTSSGHAGVVVARSTLDGDLSDNRELSVRRGVDMGVQPSVDLQRHDVSMEGVSRDGNKIGGSEVSGTMESSVSGVNVIDERQTSSGHAGVMVARSTLDGDLSDNRELSVRRGVDMGVQPSVDLQRHDVSMEGVSRDGNKIGGSEVSGTMESSVSGGVNVIDERQTSSGHAGVVVARSTLDGDLSENRELFDERQSSSGHAGVVVARSTLDGDLSENRELSVRRGVDVGVQPSVDLQRHDVSMEGVSRDGNKVGGSEVSGTMESSVSGVNVIDERQTSSGHAGVVVARSTLDGDLSDNRELSVRRGVDMGVQPSVDLQRHDVSMEGVSRDGNKIGGSEVSGTMESSVSGGVNVIDERQTSSGHAGVVVARSTLDGDLSENRELFDERQSSSGHAGVVVARSTLDGDLSENRELSVRRGVDVGVQPSVDLQRHDVSMEGVSRDGNKVGGSEVSGTMESSVSGVNVIDERQASSGHAGVVVARSTLDGDLSDNRELSVRRGVDMGVQPSVDIQRHDVSMEGVSRDGNKVGGSEVSGTMESSVSGGVNVIDERQTSSGHAGVVVARSTLDGDLSENRELFDERQSSSGHAGVVVARSTLDGDLSENRELSVRRGVDVGVQPSVDLQRHDVSMEGVSRDGNKIGGSEVSGTMESSVSGVNIIDERQTSSGHAGVVVARSTLDGDLSENRELFDERQSSSGHAGVVVARSTLDGDLSENRELSVRRGVDVGVQPSIDLQRHDVSMEGVSRDGNKVGGSEVSGTMESSVSGVNVIDERQASSGHAVVVVARSTLDGDLSDNRELSVRRGVDVGVQPSVDLQRHDVSMEGVSRDGNQIGGSEVSGTMESSVSGGVNVIDERQTSSGHAGVVVARSTLDGDLSDNRELSVRRGVDVGVQPSVDLQRHDVSMEGVSRDGNKVAGSEVSGTMESSVAGGVNVIDERQTSSGHAGVVVARSTLDGDLSDNRELSVRRGVDVGVQPSVDLQRHDVSMEGVSRDGNQIGGSEVSGTMESSVSGVNVIDERQTSSGHAGVVVARSTLDGDLSDNRELSVRRGVDVGVQPSIDLQRHDVSMEGVSRDGNKVGGSEVSGTMESSVSGVNVIDERQSSSGHAGVVVARSTLDGDLSDNRELSVRRGVDMGVQPSVDIQRHDVSMEGVSRDGNKVGGSEVSGTMESSVSGVNVIDERQASSGHAVVVVARSTLDGDLSDNRELSVRRGVGMDVQPSVDLQRHDVSMEGVSRDGNKVVTMESSVSGGVNVIDERQSSSGHAGVVVARSTLDGDLSENRELSVRRGVDVGVQPSVDLQRHDVSMEGVSRDGNKVAGSEVSGTMESSVSGGVNVIDERQASSGHAGVVVARSTLDGDLSDNRELSVRRGVDVGVQPSTDFTSSRFSREPEASSDIVHLTRRPHHRSTPQTDLPSMDPVSSPLSSTFRPGNSRLCDEATEFSPPRLNHRSLTTTFPVGLPSSGEMNQTPHNESVRYLQQHSYHSNESRREYVETDGENLSSKWSRYFPHKVPDSTMPLHSSNHWGIKSIHKQDDLSLIGHDVVSKSVQTAPDPPLTARKSTVTPVYRSSESQTIVQDNLSPAVKLWQSDSAHDFYSSVRASYPNAKIHSHEKTPMYSPDGKVVQKMSSAHRRQVVKWNLGPSTKPVTSSRRGYDNSNESGDVSTQKSLISASQESVHKTGYAEYKSRDMSVPASKRPDRSGNSSPVVSDSMIVRDLFSATDSPIRNVGSTSHLSSESKRVTLPLPSASNTDQNDRRNFNSRNRMDGTSLLSYAEPSGVESSMALSQMWVIDSMMREALWAESSPSHGDGHIQGRSSPYETELGAYEPVDKSVNQLKESLGSFLNGVDTAIFHPQRDIPNASVPSLLESGFNPLI